MKIRSGLVTAILAGCAQLAVAEEENFCDPVARPEVCQDDRLNIRFVAGDTLVSELEGVVVDQVIQAKVTIDVVTPKITCFSYGVEHDPAYLTLPQPAPDDPTCFYDPDDINTDLSGCNPTVVGTTPLIESMMVGGWNTTALAEGPGFYSVSICGSLRPKELPTDQVDYPICIMRYKVVAVPPGVGTKIFFTDGLNPVGSPPVTVNLTTNGKSKRPRTVTNGIVRNGESWTCPLANFGFFFGPEATTDPYTVTGSTCPIGLRNLGVKGLGFSLGIRKTGANLTFESNLGSPVVDLVFTKEDGTEVAGDSLKGNTATGAPTVPIMRIERGTALAANDPGDYFGVMIDASGAWATAGYVSDISGSGGSIAALADPPVGCAIQQVLTVTFAGDGEVFSRGDANGDSKINVTDGVILAQNIFANKLVFFDCQDMLDVNDDGQLNTLDPVELLRYVFLRGPVPPSPFKTCGIDPTADTLTCTMPNCR